MVDLQAKMRLPYNWWPMDKHSPQNNTDELRRLVCESSPAQREAVLALVRRYHHLKAVDPELTFDQYLDRLEFLVNHRPPKLYPPEPVIYAL
jgi:hypothetical protein